MKSSIALIFVLFTSALTSLAHAEEPAPESISCTTRFGHIDGESLESLVFKRLPELASNGAALYDAIYTPSYRTADQQPQPETLAHAIMIREHVASQPGLIEMTNGTLVDPVTREGVSIEASMIQTTIPRSGTVLTWVELNFEVVRYRVDQYGNGTRISTRELRFHPTSCVEIP